MFLVDFWVSVRFELSASYKLYNRIYELFNLYFSKEYEQTSEVIVLTSVIIFKTFQISINIVLSYIFLFNLTFPAGTCEDYITRNSGAILKLKDKKMELSDEDIQVDLETDLKGNFISAIHHFSNATT